MLKRSHSRRKSDRDVVLVHEDNKLKPFQDYFNVQAFFVEKVKREAKYRVLYTDILEFTEYHIHSVVTVEDYVEDGDVVTDSNGRQFFYE